MSRKLDETTNTSALIARLILNIIINLNIFIVIFTVIGCTCITILCQYYAQLVLQKHRMKIEYPKPQNVKMKPPAYMDEDKF